MRFGTPAEESMQQVALAERAYELWGTILEAKMAYLAEHSPEPVPGSIVELPDGQMGYKQGHPLQLKPSETVLSTMDDQIEQSQSLFQGTVEAAAYLLSRHFSGSEQQVKAPVTSAAQKGAELAQSVTGRSKEALENTTNMLIRGVSQVLDRRYLRFMTRGMEIEQKRRFGEGTTELNIRKEGQWLKTRVPNLYIVEQDDLSQVVLWYTQAKSPAHQTSLRTPAERKRLVLEMVNRGRLYEDTYVIPEVLDDYIEEAVSLGLLTNTADPAATVEGTRHVLRTIAEQARSAQESKPLVQAA
jgi:hypothetical protein